MSILEVCTDRLAVCPGCGLEMNFETSSREEGFYESIMFECEQCHVIASAETALPDLSSDDIAMVA